MKSDSLILSAKKHVINNLPHDRDDLLTSCYLASLNPGELIILYLNWLSRFIPPRPRKIYLSPEFKHYADLDEYDRSIRKVLSEIEQGVDLTLRLSTRTMHGFDLVSTGKKNLGRSKHLDLLLNDWSIHHLHCSNEQSERSKYLIFGHFAADEAFLLDVRPHGQWSAIALAEISVRNWPNAGYFIELKGLLPPQDWTENERAGLRNAGLSAPICVDRKLFTGRKILASAGTTVIHAKYATYIMRTLRQVDVLLAKDPAYFNNLAAGYAVRLPDKPLFEFTFTRDGFGIVENSTGEIIGLGRHPASL
ncbi:hypothetical protein [Alsobacter metallidurans]|uniref:hypothetical protein n=1 Tax=Alsobacter metallidurans TaxID=340221 RepID=UPI00166F3BF5|nr:hypothetical protein [Alsobacter metallidurans]